MSEKQLEWALCFFIFIFCPVMYIEQEGGGSGERTE